MHTKRTLKKAVIVQNNPYTVPENRLAQYHGAIFAEAFTTLGVSATKMVLGDPATQRPQSPLLSVSSMRQRLDPEWWKNQGYDLIVFYGGQNPKNIPVLSAIKKGLPASPLILKMDAANGPSPQTFKHAVRSFCISYVKDRHGHVSAAAKGHGSAPPIISLARSAIKALISCNPAHSRQIAELFEVPDFISYENTSALLEAQQWADWYGRRDIRGKIIWLGYPVRDAFAQPQASVARKPNSIISIANWKHAKNLPLHSKSLALALGKNPSASATLIGENSKQLLDMTLRHMPEAATRITQINEISNTALPAHLQAAQVFQLCSFTEGICSAVIEALCCGCSAALSTGIGVPCFKEFTAQDCGTQAVANRPEDMANAILHELDLWSAGKRNPQHTRSVWSKTLSTPLCRHLCEVTGLELP